MTNQELTAKLDDLTQSFFQKHQELIHLLKDQIPVPAESNQADNYAFNPPGFDLPLDASGRYRRLIASGPCKGWVAYKHSDGYWVALRQATQDDFRVAYIFGVKDFPRCNGVSFSTKSQKVEVIG